MLHPTLNVKRGAEKALLEMSLRMQERGHSIEIFTSVYDPKKCFDEFRKLTVHVCGGNVKPYDPRSILQGLKIANSIDSRFDILFAHNYPATLSAWFYKRKKNIKTAWYCHRIIESLYLWREELKRVDLSRRIAGRVLFPIVAPFLRKYERKAVASMDYIFTNSKFTSELIRELYGIEATVAYLGVNIETFKLGLKGDLIRNKHSLRDSPIVLTVGGLYPVKQVDLVIRALSLIKQTISNVKLLVVGGGPELPRLKELVNKLGLSDSVVFTIADDKALPFYYATSDVFVTAALQEPLGLTILEAMACGKPVVALDEGGHRETVVDGKTGYLVRGRVKKLAGTITKLLVDKNQGSKMGRKGRKHVEKNFTWQRTTDKILKVITH